MPQRHPLFPTAALLILALSTPARGKPADQASPGLAGRTPAVGDLVFIRIGPPRFNPLAETTRCWSTHVGIIVDFRHGDWVVAESRIPFVRKTPLRRFLRRSENRQYSIRRLWKEPTVEEKQMMLRYADAQLGRLYSLRFDLESRKTFCSKFVHDVVLNCAHQSIGETETFGGLLAKNPTAPVRFWRMWFFGSIPWQRTTITPASELASPLLRAVIENNV